jgi:hypothetical protein
LDGNPGYEEDPHPQQVKNTAQNKRHHYLHCKACNIFYLFIYKRITRESIIFSKTSTRALETTQHSIPIRTAALSSRVKRSGRETKPLTPT